jgi:hypothetical protein
MKILSIFLFASYISFAQYQSQSLDLSGAKIELGMNSKIVWDMINPELNIFEDDNDNLYITDKHDNKIGIIYVKDGIVVKVIKDWGTTYKSNAGQVFKILWNILKQYREEELKQIKILPIEEFKSNSQQNSLRFYMNNYRYIEIIIQHSVTIFEVIEETGS